MLLHSIYLRLGNGLLAAGQPACPVMEEAYAVLEHAQQLRAGGDAVQLEC